jgi:2-hydroxychromene-2-carboxylate isomerase
LYSLKQEERIKLTHRLFKAYWVDSLDVDSPAVLCALYEDVLGRHLTLGELEEKTSAHRDELRRWTDAFIKAGAIGVPMIWVGKEHEVVGEGGEMFWGGDRFHFAAGEFKKLAGVKDWLTNPPRVFRAQTHMHRKVNFYFDFSSPWTYLGWTQHLNAIKELENVTVDWTYTPLVLGIVFKEIGTPIVPSLSVTPAKRVLGQKDMERWVTYWNVRAKKNGWEPVGFEFNSHFPLRTPLALRVAIAAQKVDKQTEFKVIDAICMYSKRELTCSQRSMGTEQGHFESRRASLGCAKCGRQGDGRRASCHGRIG